jgi:site-specific recombinase XerD
MLPGVHRIRARLRSGGAAEYWYAWRGGPRILAASAPNRPALARAVAKATPAAIEAYGRATASAAPDTVSFYGLVTRYLAAMEEVPTLGPRSRSDRRKHLDFARGPDGALSKMEVRAFESRKARAFLLKWRDGFKATPKTADERLYAVSVVLAWAVDQGELSANPVADFPRIYHSNRAEIIWRPDQQAAILEDAAPAFRAAFELAACSGIREDDLIRLPKTAVGQDAIVWQTAKSRRRRTIVIPITPRLRRCLAAMPRHSATTVLASSRGRPWTASGLAAALRRQRLNADKKAKERRGPEAQADIEGLRWHDLRGTAATNFLLDGLEFQEVALILGWKPDRVKEIAARYVSGQAMGLAMVRRLARNAKKDRAQSA